MWSRTYHVPGMTMDQAAADVTSRLGIDLQRRYTSYGGPYFVWRQDRSELIINDNVIDGGELTGGDLTYPALPEGVIVTVNTELDTRFRDQLDAAPGFELLEAIAYDEDVIP